MSRSARPPRRRSRLRAGSLLFACAAALSAAPLALTLAPAACSSVDSAATVEVTCPPFDDPATPNVVEFDRVSAVLERRCGTIDCHGSPSRPFKVYGQPGLRRPEDADTTNVPDLAGYYPGGDAGTTDAEIDDNYRSLCGLEPELVARVVKGELDPAGLTVVRKARLREKHKGGLIWNEGEPGDVCLVSWLQGTPIASKCDEELGHP